MTDLSGYFGRTESAI